MKHTTVFTESCHAGRGAAECGEKNESSTKSCVNGVGGLTMGIIRCVNAELTLTDI